jgi:hypothetical protein
MQKNTSGTKKLNRRPCSLVSPLAGSLQLPYEHLMAPGKIKMEALTIIQTWWLTGKPIWLVGGFKHVFSTIYIYIWDNPSHWWTQIFQDAYCTTNQPWFGLDRSTIGDGHPGHPGHPKFLLAKTTTIPLAVSWFSDA